MPQLKKQITWQEALIKMESMCAGSEYCEYEINTRLVKLGIKADKRREIINHLIENRFIDNERFSLSFARDKARFSYWGPYKIQHALASLRISSATINKAINGVEQQNWEDALLKNASSKARTLNLIAPAKEGYDNRKKLFLYLIGRGFSSQDSNRAVKIMREKQLE